MGLLVVFVAALTADGCGCIAPTVLSTAESPTNQYRAQTYTRECGVMVPFNNYTRIRTAGGDWTDIVAIRNAPFIAKLQWLGPQDLRVTVDCETDALCGVDPDRYWSVTGSKRWKDIRITYQIGDRLRKDVSADVLTKLPHDE